MAESSFEVAEAGTCRLAAAADRVNGAEVRYGICIINFGPKAK